MPSEQPSLHLASLPSTFWCPTCKSVLLPALSFPCMHKVCAECVATEPPTQCNICGFHGVARCDAPMTEATALALVDACGASFANCIGESAQERLLTVQMAISKVNNDGITTRADIVKAILREAQRPVSNVPALLVAIIGVEPTSTTVVEADEESGPSSRGSSQDFHQPPPVQRPATPPSAVRPESGPQEVLLVWDFDQTQMWSSYDVKDVFMRLAAKLKSDGVVADMAHLHATAFGVNEAFVADGKTKALQDFAIEMRVASSAKKEETDRMIEQFVNGKLLEQQHSSSPEKRLKAVVIISSDKDFNRLVVAVRRAKIDVIVVHDAPEGSEHALFLDIYASRTVSITQLVAGRKLGNAGTAPLAPPPPRTVQQGVIQSVRMDVNGKPIADIITDEGRKVFVHSNDARPLELRDGLAVSFVEVVNPMFPARNKATEVRPLGSTASVPEPPMAATSAATPSTFAPTPGKTYSGTVLSWKPETHTSTTIGGWFGFIKPDEGGFADNVFVATKENPHLAGSGALRPGDRVTFIAVENPRRPLQALALAVTQLQPDAAAAPAVDHLGSALVDTLPATRRRMETPGMPSLPTYDAPVAPAPSGVNAVGIVKKVGTDRQGGVFGFVGVDGHDKDIFFNVAESPHSGPLKIGDRVRMLLVENNGRGKGHIKAINIEKIYHHV